MRRKHPVAAVRFIKTGAGTEVRLISKSRRGTSFTAASTHVARGDSSIKEYRASRAEALSGLMTLGEVLL